MGSPQYEWRTGYQACPCTSKAFRRTIHCEQVLIAATIMYIRPHPLPFFPVFSTSYICHSQHHHIIITFTILVVISGKGDVTGECLNKYTSTSFPLISSKFLVTSTVKRLIVQIAAQLWNTCTWSVWTGGMLSICDKVYFFNKQYVLVTIYSHASSSFSQYIHEFSQSHMPGEETVKLYVIVGTSIAYHSQLRFGNSLCI